MTDLCKYADYFGAPGTGVHQYRIFNIAIVDLALTILAALIVARLLNASFFLTTVVFLLAGIVAHRMFCVRTTVDKLLFP